MSYCGKGHNCVGLLIKDLLSTTQESILKPQTESEGIKGNSGTKIINWGYITIYYFESKKIRAKKYPDSMTIFFLNKIKDGFTLKQNFYS